jgi:hypothetical protein
VAWAAAKPSRPTAAAVAEAAGRSTPGESPQAIEAFVEEHNADALRNAEAVLEALRRVRTCDPACGSGAYLLGMLHELLDLRSQRRRGPCQRDADQGGPHPLPEHQRPPRRMKRCGL